MPHSLTKIWVHIVFGTKHRNPLIEQSFEDKLYQHIRERLVNDFDCSVLALNGMPDHIHILIRMSQNYALKDIIKNIKGESTHWINENFQPNTTFAWQVGYGAFSVGGSSVDIVARYIQNQKLHHREKSLLVEYEPINETHDPM